MTTQKESKTTKRKLRSKSQISNVLIGEFCYEPTGGPTDKPVKLTSTKCSRHVRGKDLRYLLISVADDPICRKSIPGSIGGLPQVCQYITTRLLYH